MVAPSFWACLTEEFINTVHRVPRSTGRSAKRPSFANSVDVVAQRLGEGLRESEPQPEEQASLRKMLSDGAVLGS